MYSNEHSTVATGITVISVMVLGVEKGLITGFVLGWFSHYLLDYIAEPSYPGGWLAPQSTSYVVFVFCMIMLAITGHWVYLAAYVIGIISGNLADLIDKPWLFKKEMPLKYQASCHNGGSWFFRIGKFKLGFPTIIKTSIKQYFAINRIAIILIVALTFFIFYYD